jgi:hypothetical protein
VSASTPFTGEPLPAKGRLAALAAAVLGLGLALGAAPAKADRGTALCPGALFLSLSPAHTDFAGSGITAQQLIPGGIVDTLGSGALGLAGSVIDSTVSIKPFTINTPDGTVKGQLQQMVVNANDGTCDCYWRVRVLPASAPGWSMPLMRSRFTRTPGAGLFADFRSDLVPLGVAPFEATRSAGSGSTITFKFDPGIAPGETSRWVFLDSQVDFVAEVNGRARLRTDNNVSSEPIVTYVTLQD